MEIKKTVYLSILFSIISLSDLFSQESFSLEIVPASIEGMPALHSFAHAQWEGKWLIVGGQTVEETSWTHQNLNLIVIDPKEERIWKASVDNLEHYIEAPEQISTCFAQYYQFKEKMYLVGGYGFNTREEAFITFPYLSEINVKAVIEDIINDRHKNLGKHFKQVYEEDFGIMEGHLTQINNKFYLLGGVRINIEMEDGYPQFQNAINDQVFEFVVQEETKGELNIKSLGAFHYKEDFDEWFPTVAPQIFPDGSQGLTIFKNNADSINASQKWINLFEVGYSLREATDQNIPHYHSTVIPIYDELNATMHTIFLGGCNDYYCNVEDIYGEARLVDSLYFFQRESNGQITMGSEELNYYLAEGRDAKFLPADQRFYFENGVLKLNQLTNTRTLVGYIFGGASSVNPMIYDNGDILARASNQLWKVYLTKRSKVEGEIKVIYPSEENTTFSLQIPYPKK